MTNIKIAFGPNANTAPPIAWMDLLAAAQHAQIALLMDLGPQPASISWSGEYAIPAEIRPFDPAEFTQDDDGAAAGVYQRNCDLVLQRGLYRERGLVFAQMQHGQSAWRVLGVKGAGTEAPPRSSTKSTKRVQSEAVHDSRCVHSTTGVGDLSVMPRFDPAAAKAWNIRF